MVDEKDVFFKLGSIPKGKTRGWTIKINGVQMDNVIIDGESCPIRMIEMENAKLGLEYVYGWMPLNHEDPENGYDMVSVRERCGGGSITVIYAKLPSGQVVVALSPDNRRNMGGTRWCIPGGFVRAGESHAQTQRREASEETGLEAQEALEALGLPVVCNRALYVADPYKGEGIHVFKLEILSDSLCPADMVEISTISETNFYDSYKLKDGVSLDAKNSQALRFFATSDLKYVSGDGLAIFGVFNALC